MTEQERYDLLSQQIIGSAIEVHRALGPGLLESADAACLCHELGLRGLAFERQAELPVEYKGLEVDAGFGMDLVVNQLIVVELKSVDRLEPIHTAQLLTYLRLSGHWMALLMNFNVPQMPFGIKRLVSGSIK